MFNDKEITLKELLISREERVKTQKRLISELKANLISFMVNIPGTKKDTFTSRKLHNEGRSILENELAENGIKILYNESYYRPTGAETFILINLDAKRLKEILVDIEDKHPLGRLFDFDVIDINLNKISRTDIGHKSRKCLLCDEDAAVCARSQKHSNEDLIKEVYFITYKYFDEI